MPGSPISNSSAKRRVAGTSYPDRRVRFSQRTRSRVNFRKGHKATGKGGDIASPTNLDCFEIFIGNRTAVLKIETQCGELLLRPADTDTKDKAPTRKYIDICS